MKIAGRFRSVKRKDHAIPQELPRPLLGRDKTLDIRIWRRAEGDLPLLLATASRRQGSAVERNRYRRRVRMAFLELLRKEAFHIPADLVVWMRPSRYSPVGCRIDYSEIEGQLRLALSCWGRS